MSEVALITIKSKGPCDENERKFFLVSLWKSKTLFVREKHSMKRGKPFVIEKGLTSFELAS